MKQEARPEKSASSPERQKHRVTKYYQLLREILKNIDKGGDRTIANDIWRMKANLSSSELEEFIEFVIVFLHWRLQ